MSLLQVVQDVCAVVGVQAPTTVVGAVTTNRTMFEMLALANEMAQRIAYDLREWREQKKTGTFVGDGVLNPVTNVVTGTSAFNLPPDYLRMLLKGNVWRSTSALQPMVFISDIDDWNQRRALGNYGAWGEWTLLGNQMLIWPIMMGPIAANPPSIPEAVPAVTASFSYLDRNCVILNAGGVGDRFMNDADTFRLPERLLKLGMIFQWKANKGSPYAEDMGTFGDALSMLMGANKPMPIMIGSTPVSMNTRIAYPFGSDQTWTWPLH